jgi:hypothetical protein
MVLDFLIANTPQEMNALQCREQDGKTSVWNGVFM